LQADPTYAPFAERVAAVMPEIERVADKTGKKSMYAFNITGDVDHMLRSHDLVKQHGGTCVMVNVNSVGLAALAHVRRHCELPIHGHRANFGAMSRHPLLGIGFSAFQKLFRLAGVDHLHVGGFNSKFYETNEEVGQSIVDCLTPMFGDYRAMPAISSAQWAGSAIDIYAAILPAAALSPIRTARRPACAACSKAGRQRSRVSPWMSTPGTTMNCEPRSRNSEDDANGK
jgi:ribulose-bisphosphate carboxylase large chain